MFHDIVSNGKFVENKFSTYLICELIGNLKEYLYIKCISEKGDRI